MKTPITNNLFAPMWLLDGPPTDVHLYEAQRSHRRLEIDRATLMDALEECEMDFSPYEGDPKYPAKNSTLRTIRAALAAARANFPDED